jgi:colanic acid/amylovoran biosynthesis glycosyltransferase
VNEKPIRALRIAYITVAAPGASSGEEFFLPEIRALMKRGYQLTLVPREHKPSVSRTVDPALQAISKVVGLAAPEVIWEFVKMMIREPSRLFRIFSECCLDTGWSNKAKNIRVFPKGIWLGQFARREAIDHIHAQWCATTATLAEIAHRVSGVPWSLTLHRGDIVQNNRLRQKLGSASFTRFISLDGIDLYKRIAGHDPQSAGNVKVIHMGVDIPAASTQASFAGEGTFKIVCPANLLPLKGHIFLFEAVELLRQRGLDVRLFLAGRGPLRSYLEAWVNKHELGSRVTFLGQQDRSALLEKYRNRTFHAVVLGSIDMGNGQHEGIPVSLMEGMAFGLPVISTHTGGIPELLRGGAGILVSPQSSESLADAIESLATDSEFASKIGRQGRERILAEFEIEGVIDMFARCIEASV